MGLAILPGLVRPDEGLPTSQGGQGVINHAIRFTLQNSVILNQFLYPASHVANPGNTNPSTQPPMGARFRLKAGIDISSLNPQSRIIAQAMKVYGMIVADNGSNFYFSGASYAVDANNNDVLTWNDDDIQDTQHGLKSLTYSDFEVVDLTPLVTGLSITSGVAGTSLTIAGKNFSGAAGHLQVLFGSAAATSISVLDDSHVLAVVPAGSGTVDVRVQSGVSDPNDPQNIKSPIFGYGSSAVSVADRFTYGIVSNAATHLSIAAPAPTIAGAGVGITVTALDANNTTADSYLGTVHFTSSDPKASLPADYVFTTADHGVHTFTLTLKSAGSQSVSLTDTAWASIQGSASAIVVNPAAASQLSLAAPATARAATRFSVTLAALDPYGNPATAYTGTVHFASTDPAASLPADYTFSAADHGLHTFSGLMLRAVGTKSLTASDTVVAFRSSANIAVTPYVPVLATPGKLTAKALSRSKIRLVWADNSTAETGFFIERSTDAKTWTHIATVAANSTTYTNTSLSRRRKYYYRARAVSTATKPATYSNLSNTASATTLS